jgi:simple sugar transport system permease protein
MWETIFSYAFMMGLFAAGVRIAAPVLLAALGELVSEKAGVLNIGLDGFMLVGSLAGFLGAYYFQNCWIGMLTGMLAGILISLLHAYLSITLCTDQVVNGIAINIIALGLTSLIFRVLFGISTLPPRIQPLGIVNVPYLSEIPVLGPILFQQSPVVYLSILISFLCWVVVFKTDFGLALRATGEKPEAADTAGISVARMRYIGVMTAGGLAGLGGAFLSVAQLGSFTDSMTAGRGFIALAVVIFGRWSPFGAVIVSFFFGLAYAFQLSLQALGFNVPYQFLLMLPYVLTMVALAGSAGHRGAPAAIGTAYQKS